MPNENDPKDLIKNNNPTQNNPTQINESINISEKFGDLLNKSERSEGHYAKPFINEIIQTPTNTGITDTNNTNNTNSGE